MNADLCKKGLEKVSNPNVLINLVSRRVRQLNSGGSSGRPLISETANMGAADIALAELVDDKMAWELSADNPLVLKAEPRTKRSKKH